METFLVPGRVRSPTDQVDRGDLDELTAAIGGEGWDELPPGEQEYIAREAEHLLHKARREAFWWCSCVFRAFS